MKRILLFGIFDGKHEDHKDLLTEAREYGEELIVVVAQDHIVEHLLGRLPQVDFVSRFEELKKEDGVAKVVIGNSDMPPIGIIKRYKPDIIACASDQSLLEGEIREALSHAGIDAEVIKLNAREMNEQHES